MDETTGNEAMNTTFEGSINIISSAINKTPNAAEYITLLANTSSEIVNDETEDQNLRYIGANPNNYVYFNCEDYNNPTSDTCELWRIIGVMNNMELADGTTGQSLVKLVRAESIGNLSWDNKPTGVGPDLRWANNVYSLRPEGNVMAGVARGSNAVKPSLYLSSNVRITSGDGSSSSPFVLTM